MLGLRTVSRRLEEQDKEIFGIVVDLILDGLLLGIGFAAGNSEGMMLAFALSLKLLALDLATNKHNACEKRIGKRKTFVVILLLSFALARDST